MKKKVKFRESLRVLETEFQRPKSLRSSLQYNQAAKSLNYPLLEKLEEFKHLKCFKGLPCPNPDDDEWINNNFPMKRESETLASLDYLCMPLNNMLGERLFARGKNFFPSLRHLSLVPYKYEKGFESQLGVKNFLPKKLKFPETLLSLSLTYFGNYEFDFAFLGNLLKLEYLELNASLGYLFARDFSGISKLENLKIFKYEHYKHDDRVQEIGQDDKWKVLSTLQKLEIVQFKNHVGLGDSTLSVLCNMSNLLHLNIGGCIGVKDLSPLSKLVNLTSLNTFGITAEKIMKECKSLVTWITSNNFANFLHVMGEELSFPCLSKIIIQDDYTFSQKSVECLLLFPSLREVRVNRSNLQVEWLNNVPKAKKLILFEALECVRFKEYFKKKTLLSSNEMEKEMTRRALRVTEKTNGPIIDAQLGEFKPYLLLFFEEASNKCERGAVEFVETARKHMMECGKRGGELRRAFAEHFANHPAKTLLGKIQNDIEKNVDDVVKSAKQNMIGVLKKNWVYFHKEVLKSMRVLDFVPSKFHKLYMGLDVFLGPVWKVSFSAKNLKMERNLLTQFHALYLLMIVKRNKLIFPKPIMKMILSIIPK